MFIMNISKSQKALITCPDSHMKDQCLTKLSSLALLSFVVVPGLSCPSHFSLSQEKLNQPLLVNYSDYIRKTPIDIH